MASLSPIPQAELEPRIAVVFSRGIRAIRHLNVLADVDLVLSPKQVKLRRLTPSCVLVWGRKSNTVAALAYAEEHGIAVHYLEDGWIRSSASNPHSRTCYSILKDTTGVYYDSRSPSDLENWLNLSAAQFQEMVSPEALDYARQCRKRMVDSNITKYNFTSMQLDKALFGNTEASEPPTNLNATGDVTAVTVKRVLVIDQTRDDASVTYGAMDAEAFNNMLRTAIAENPQAKVVVRMHPDVVSGLREGYLHELAKSLGVEISADAVNPIMLLKQVDKVYVGTSQLGYEALLCDKPVVVFGEPFYAGWGLTDDRSTITRRTQQRSIDEMFYATHIALARYCNPTSGELWKLHECLEHVELQQSMFARNALHFKCVGIKPWKQKYLRQYLRSPDGSVSFLSDSQTEREPETGPEPLENANNVTEKTVSLTWSYRAFGDIRADAEQAVNGRALYRIEDGFLRSAGLGSDFNAPASLVLDELGLYFDPTRPSDLEALLNQYDCTPAQIFRAVALKKLILSSRLSKYNIGTESNILLPDSDKPHVLVVGQVEDDESIKRGCDKVRTNGDLLAQVRKARPDAWIRYKPHPDVVAGNREGYISDAMLNENADAVDAEASIIDCIDACDELHTMTSLSGFEALMRGKRVVTYGTPFYAGWGLTEDHQPIARRTRRRTLDELVYLSLIMYPRYVDIDTGEFTTPENLVRTIISQRAMNKKIASGWPARKIKKLANIVRGLRYAP